MKEIFFIKTGKAYLPEIEGYGRAFAKKGFSCGVISPEEVARRDSANSAFWFFMGFYPHKIVSKGFVVHDYRSLSTGSMRGPKDFLKRAFQPKPSLRVFLNENVKKRMNFKDSVPSCLIDMGVDFPQWGAEKGRDVIYDYVYVGDVSKDRGIDRLLAWFAKTGGGKRLLLVGRCDEELRDAYGSPNIIFAGKVERERVYEYLMQSGTGISYVPRGMPYDLQTSTKMLEYAWCGLNILANDSPSNILTAKKLSFECSRTRDPILGLKIVNTGTGSIRGKLSWDKIIDDSGLFKHLRP